LEQQRQRQRILDRAAKAPRRLPDSQFPVSLTGDPGNDLDYYIYELARLQDMGKSIIKVFGQPQERVDAQAEFVVGIPKLRVIRDPLTHPNDNDELDEVAWFSSAVKLKPDGSVELVDPRYEQHEVATAYHLAPTKYLQTQAWRDAHEEPHERPQEHPAAEGTGGVDRGRRGVSGRSWFCGRRRGDACRRDGQP